MNADLPQNAYQNMEVTTSSNLKLVVMLYEGAIRFLNEAKTAIQNKNLIGKAQAVDRTLAIIGELQSTLKLEEGGDIALSLDRLYTYMTERILDASSRLQTGPLDEVVKLLRIVHAAWSEIARKAEVQSGVAASAPPILPLPTNVGQGDSPRRPLEVFG